MRGADFGPRIMLPLIAVVFLAGGVFFAAVFLGLPWLWEHVNVIVK